MAIALAQASSIVRSQGEKLLAQAMLKLTV
jgi:hypothetical protein